MLAQNVCFRMLSTNCLWHNDHTNKNYTVDFRSYLKMESEEDIYTNLETLLVLLCFTSARHL